MDGKYRQAFQKSIEPACKSKAKYCHHTQTNSNSVSWLSLFLEAANSYSFILPNRIFLSASVSFTLIFVFVFFFPVWDPEELQKLENKLFPSCMK